MIRFSLQDVARATSASIVAAGDGRDVTGVVIDSRKVEDGSLFACFPGERVNGNDFALKAAQAGAACVVVTQDMDAAVLDGIAETGCAVLRAADDDPTEFLLRLAGAWRERNQQWTVVGVTGSVGKTTTKDMLRAALSTKYRVHATAGNFNNLIGVPLTLCGASADDEVVVCEMGMNHAGELTRLSACARPQVAVVTNVGTAHIGLLGSRENIARAKAEITSGMEPRPAAGADGATIAPKLFLTSDNDFAGLIADEYARPRGIETGYVGTAATDDVRASHVTLDDEGRAAGTVAFADGASASFAFSAPGLHLVNDYLLAMAVARELGCDVAAASKAVCTMPQTHMRLEIVGGTDGHPRVIDDSYNASPSSVAAALDVLCRMKADGRRVAVLGEMGELGDEAARLHGYVGAYAAACPLDMLVLIGTEYAADIAEAARTMGFSEDRLETFATTDDALAALSGVFDEKDLVLVKASRAAELDRFVKGVLA